MKLKFETTLATFRIAEDVNNPGLCPQKTFKWYWNGVAGAKHNNKELSLDFLCPVKFGKQDLLQVLLQTQL